jgi:hypothetical protein
LPLALNFQDFLLEKEKELEIAWEEAPKTCIREDMSSHDWFIGWGS